MKKSYFEIGDVIEKERNGFKRRIESVITGYRYGRTGFGYIYSCFFGFDRGWVTSPSCVCSEEHLRAWGRKIYEV